MTFESILRRIKGLALVGALAALTGGCPDRNIASLIETPIGFDGSRKNASLDDEPPATPLPAEVSDPANPPPLEDVPIAPPPFAGPFPDDGVIQPIPNHPHEPQPEPTFFGRWILDDGEMLPTFVNGLRVVALDIEQHGRARVFFRDAFTGAIDAVSTFALFDGDTLVMDFSLDVEPIINPDPFFFFPVVVVSADSLGLADETGRIALFSRRDSLPDEILTRPLAVSDRFDRLPAPNFFSDLVLFNGDLVYSSSTHLERFDVRNDALAAPLADVSTRLVQTVQPDPVIGDTFWTHCGCGGSRDVFRRNLTTVFDTVSSDNELGGAVSARGVAYVSTTDRLWIHGFSQIAGRQRFHVVNTNGEPDQLVRTIEFNREIRALAFDGESLWAIVRLAGDAIVRIDPDDGRVLESFDAPDTNTTWTGLTFDDQNMYLLGTDADNQGVIVRAPRAALSDR